MSKKILDIVKEIDKSGVAIKAYDDLFHPTAKLVGTTVYRTVKTALAPLRGLVWTAEQFEEWMYTKVASNLEDVPNENIITPDPLVAVPLIQQVRISGKHEHLKDLYAKLLAKSMNSEEADKILPSYVDIIKQLSPLDVKILELLKKDPNNRGILADIVFKKERGRITYFKNLSLMDIDSPRNISIAIDNLIRLNLAEVPFGQSLIYASYDKFKSTTVYQNAKTSIPEDAVIDIQKKMIELTDFGLDFINQCN